MELDLRLCAVFFYRARRYVVEIKCQTAIVICTVLMAAACFPEEQAKVQAELDAVIGRHRGSSICYCNSIDSMVLLDSADLC
jgi:hypothetical protein